MNITNRLINGTQTKQQLLRSLSAYAGDIFLYGAGLHADCIVDWYCEPHGIGWTGAVVDDEFVRISGGGGIPGEACSSNQ